MATDVLVSPNSKTESSSPVKPVAVWFGHLFLHRVEALVSVARTGRPDALGRLVLQSVAQAPASTAALDARLHLGPAVLRQLLRCCLTDSARGNR